jgi:two-component system response regulator FlrC
MDARAQKILLVDDDQHVRETICETLRRHRYDVTTAGGFVEGRRLLIETRPPFDLVITDIRLGDGTGVQLAREIVENMSPVPRILLISAYLDDPNITQLLVNGHADVLLKPFPLRALMQHVTGTHAKAA